MIINKTICVKITLCFLHQVRLASFLIDLKYIKSDCLFVLLHSFSAFLLRLFIALISFEYHGTNGLVIMVFLK